MTSRLERKGCLFAACCAAVLIVALVAQWMGWH